MTQPWPDERELQYAQRRVDQQRDDAFVALELVLLFHRGGPWSQADSERWREITGADNASTKGLCDHVRKVLAAR